ncbi:MAG: hypothetical protein WC986_01360 [Elusimicrobiota bacterium]
MEDYARYVSESLGPFFRLDMRGGRATLRQVPRHPMFPESQTLFLEKTPGRLRVVVLGESSAFLLAQSLSARVKRNGLDARVEIVNMTAGGAGMEHVLRRFHEAAELSPDAIVVLFGHNLFYRHPIALAEPAALRPALRLLKRSRLFLWICGRMFGVNLLHAEDFHVPGRWKAYRAVLSGMAEASRRRGIQLVLCTVPGNLRVPPQASLQQPPPGGCLEAKFLYWSGREEEGMRMAEARLSGAMFSWGDFQLGEWLCRAGRYGEARKSLQKALDNDIRRWRASTAVNALIRDVVREKGLRLLDFERMFALGAPHGIPGWESFQDAQHPWTADQEAGEVLRAFQIASRPEPRAEPGPQERARVLAHVVNDFSLKDRLSRAAALTLAESGLFSSAAEMEAAISAQQRSPEETGALFSCFSEALWRSGRKDDAERFNEKARLLAPMDAEPFLQEALFRLSAGRTDEARSWLQKTLALSPNHPEAGYYLKRLSLENERPRSGRTMQQSNSGVED